jgi:hypothetical protein
MKFFELILVLFFTISITSCSSNDDTPALTLSVANVASSYNITSYNIEEVETATSSTGSVTTLSTITKVGKTFQEIDMTLNVNMSFTTEGKHAFDRTINPTPSSGKPDDLIIDLDGITGSYQLNTSENTISFTTNSDEFINGTFDIVSYTETTLNLIQEKVTTNGGISVTTNTKINFTKK